MPEAINLVYILSNGRSGTTLLDLLLGSAPGAWTVGEAQLVPWQLRDRSARCGCGEYLHKCGFWELVDPLASSDVTRYSVEHFREKPGSGRVLRWKLLFDLLRGSNSVNNQAAVEEYGRANAELFRAVREVVRRRSGGRIQWLIDASLDPYRLLWLAGSGLFNLRIIHLTKSPPAFVYSMVKEELPRGLSSTVRMSGRWLVENGLMMRLCNAAFSDEQTWHLRYEDLAGRPEKVRRRLSSWLNLDFPAWDGKSFRSYENHAIAGNQMRWENTEIRLDRRWEKKLPRIHRAISRGITFPVAGILGY